MALSVEHGQLPSVSVKVEPDDLVDAVEVATIIGLTNFRGVSVYRHRHTDFPEPVIERGRCLLWLRADVERWAASRRG